MRGKRGPLTSLAQGRKVRHEENIYFAGARGIDLFFWQRGLRYRAGTLRGWRSLRDLSTGFALGLPMVGNGDSLVATNGSLDPKGVTHHEVIASRAGSPAGRPCLFLHAKWGDVRSCSLWTSSRCDSPSQETTVKINLLFIFYKSYSGTRKRLFPKRM
jgi:hypothetical protein